VYTSVRRKQFRWTNAQKPELGITEAFAAGGWCPSGVRQSDHAARIARFAVAAVAAAAAVPVDPVRRELGTVVIRAGFHSGPVVASVVGKKNPRYW
jgi:class 3 adenylate cyclase